MNFRSNPVYSIYHIIITIEIERQPIVWIFAYMYRITNFRTADSIKLTLKNICMHILMTISYFEYIFANPAIIIGDHINRLFKYLLLVQVYRHQSPRFRVTSNGETRTDFPFSRAMICKLRVSIDNKTNSPIAEHAWVYANCVYCGHCLMNNRQWF